MAKQADESTSTTNQRSSQQQQQQYTTSASTTFTSHEEQQQQQRYEQHKDSGWVSTRQHPGTGVTGGKSGGVGGGTTFTLTTGAGRGESWTIERALQVPNP
jgi:hypothetical protein